MKQVPNWIVERIAVGEWDVGGHCADVAPARLESLARSSERILADLPPSQVAREVRRRLHLERARLRDKRRVRVRKWAAGGVLATAMAVAIALITHHHATPPELAQIAQNFADNGTRIKGNARLIVHRRSDDNVERLRSGARAWAGDHLQLSYVAAGQSHGVIVSIDGRGSVTLHFPEDPDGDMLLRDDGAIPLGHSYELDRAPVFERFVFVTADSSLSVAAVLDAARALARDMSRAHSAPLTLPGPWQQVSFSLRKVD